MSYGSGVIKYYETPELEATPVDDDTKPLPVTTGSRTVTVDVTSSASDPVITAPTALTTGNSAVDAFGRVRMSEPATIFDSKLLHDKAPLFWDETITNTSGNAASTHSTSDALVTMLVEAQDTIIRQTKMRFNYQPGKSQLVLVTGILTSGGTGVTGRVGAFDANDGYFFEVDGTTISVGIRKGGSDTTVAQSSWNIDKMDGTGVSGVTTDFDKAQIFVIDYEWLGVGKVRFGFGVNGGVQYCHEIDHANVVTAAYTATPNQPIRYEIASALGGDSVTMKHICSSVVSEAGFEENGTLHMHSTGGTHLDANAANSIYACLGIKLKSTHLDAVIDPAAISIIVENTIDFEWFLAFNPTIAGTFTYSDLTNSAVQIATGVTANTITADSWDIRFTGGFVKSGQSAGQTEGDLHMPLRIGSLIDGTPDELVLCIRPLGVNADIQATLSWKELL